MEDISLHLLDIIENSARAESSLVQISIEINKKENSLKIRVEDDGHGMDEDMLINSQNPFFTTKTGGTGLGLSIVHSILESYNTFLEVESKINEGSTFTLKFRSIRPLTLA